MRDFRKLHTWQHGHALTLAIYSASASIPRTGYPGLTSQLRRSAAAVPTNLAEGCGHTSRREFARFVQVALASTVETEYHLQLCHDLGVIDPKLATQLITGCRRRSSPLYETERGFKAIRPQGTVWPQRRIEQH